MCVVLQLPRRACTDDDNDVDEVEGRSRGGHTRRHRGGSPLLIIFPFSRVRSTDGSSAAVAAAVATVVVVVDKESEFFFPSTVDIQFFAGVSPSPWFTGPSAPLPPIDAAAPPSLPLPLGPFDDDGTTTYFMDST